MAPIIPEEVPDSMSAGTTVRFHRNFPDYPASDAWGYVFYANGATAKFQQAATVNPDGTSFDILIPASLTASVAAGRYQCAEVLTNTSSGEVIHPTGDFGELQIEPNVATAPIGAFVSHIERALVVIEAALESRLTSDMQSYQVAGRNITKIPIKELSWFRGVYKAKLYQLTHPGRFGPQVLVTFREPAISQGLPPTWVDITGFESW